MSEMLRLPLSEGQARYLLRELERCHSAAARRDEHAREFAAQWLLSHCKDYILAAPFGAPHMAVPRQLGDELAGLMEDRARQYSEAAREHQPSEQYERGAQFCANVAAAVRREMEAGDGG